MPASELSDAAILDSWRKNVDPWTDAVRQRRIDSRRLVTDQAVIDSVGACAPQSVLDVGCGEGWLVRALTAVGIRAVGVDAIPGLVERARQAGAGEYALASYDDLLAGVPGGRYDVVVCNFALLGHESVTTLFQAVPALLNAGGHFIVQTLHPAFANGQVAYCDGWRAGSWAGFEGDFVDPAPWYFRTLGSWQQLFLVHRLSLQCVLEPLHPQTRRPASVIFVAAVDPDRREA